MQQAVDNLWRYTGELFVADALEIDLSEQGIAVDPRTLQAEWQATVHTALLDSGLQIPQEAAFRSGGKQGLHSEHLGPMLAEMQYLQRSYPVSSGNRRWLCNVLPISRPPKCAPCGDC
jgi:ring-1,2-phenylacetyl-CoA epoxidase subunit PaaC